MLSIELNERANIAMFSDNSLVDYRNIIVNQSYFVDGILNNTSLIARFETPNYCLMSLTTGSSSSSSLVKNLITYSNYTFNTFESKKVHDIYIAYKFSF